MQYDAFRADRSRRQPTRHMAFWCSIVSRGGGSGVVRRVWPALALLLILAAALLLGGTGTGPAMASSHFIDYDVDNDNLIEIRTLAQLNAIRYELGGTGLSQITQSDRDNYAAAFPNRKPNWPNVMGCPGNAWGFCEGYELAADLDFDTNGDGRITAADGAISWNGGAGWAPIGRFTNTGLYQTYSGTFQGNGHTISNMMINSDGVQYVGLFGNYSANTGPALRFIEGVGLVDVDITANFSGAPAGTQGFAVGTLAGIFQKGSVRSSYATGKITVTTNTGADGASSVGGLVGYALNTSNTTGIAASYANVNIVLTSTTPSSNTIHERVGGLVGIAAGAGAYPVTITACYAAGAVTGARTVANAYAPQVGGLAGYIVHTTLRASYATGQPRTSGAGVQYLGGLFGFAGAGGTTENSYWDTATSLIPDDTDDNAPEGKSTADLRRPAGYTGIYAGWNVDVDNADGDNDLTTGVDDPWDFGTAAQYPVLKGPIALALARADLTVFSGQEVTLDGGLARDVRGRLETFSTPDATYAWRQVGGDDVMLSALDVASPTFTAPTGLTEAVTLTFAVKITLDPDDPDSVVLSDLVDVTVNPALPNELISLTVNAGGNQRPLTPPFASSRRSFDTYVGAYTGRAEIAMTPAEDAATISFNGDDPAVGARTESVGLAEGHNRFTITVTPPEPEAPADGDDDAAADAAEPLEPVTYHLNIRRQRTPKLAFNPPHYLLMNEGETATYTVELDTRWLGAEVIINISSDNPDITVSPDTVSISQYDWSERTITVTAAKDADGDDDYATIRHIANGGHYNNVGGRLRVEVADDDIVPTPTPEPTPGPTPTPTPTPIPGLPTVANTFTTTVPVDGQTVTITREAGSLTGVTLAYPATLTRDLQVTIAPLLDGIPLASERFGLGTMGVTLTVVGVPAGGLEICLPLSDALVSEAGSRPLTLVRYEGTGWQGLPGAERRGMSVCADRVSTGLFAAAYALPQLGPASDLTVAAGDAAGTLVLRWTAGANATRHWVAGIKQSDWDAGDFSGLIWTAASGSTMHTVSGLDSGAEYVFAVAAGRGAEWSGWTGLVRGTPN